MMGATPDLDAINTAIECFLRLKRETEKELFGDTIESVKFCLRCGDKLDDATRIGNLCSIECATGRPDGENAQRGCKCCGNTFIGDEFQEYCSYMCREEDDLYGN